MPHSIPLITTIAAALRLALIPGFVAVRLKLPALEQGRNVVREWLPPDPPAAGGAADALQLIRSEIGTGGRPSPGATAWR